MSWLGRIVRVYDPRTGTTRDGKVISTFGGANLEAEFLTGNPRVQRVTIGEEAELLEHNEMAGHTVKRDPHPRSFAHAILLDQFSSEYCWLIIDAYGPVPAEGGGRLATDDEVRDWPVVYTPEHSMEWRERHARGES